jgi:hypothetical protein
MLGACSEHAPSKLQDLRWYYVSRVHKRAKTARISLPYAPTGPAVARVGLFAAAASADTRRGVPLQRSVTTPAMFDAHFPDLTTLAPTLGVLTAMITPAILILAAGTLITSTSNRLGRVVDRVRALSDSFEALETGDTKTAFVEERRRHIFDQLDKLTSRARLLQLSMTSYYLALAAFVATSVIIGLLAFVTPEKQLSPYVPVVAALTGMFFLFTSSILLIYEARLATTAVIDEMAFITTLGRRLAPSEWSEIRGAKR